MSMNRTSDPPHPGIPSTPADLTGKLGELRLWAGRPSLRRLRQLGGAQRTAGGDGEVDALPESTTSYVLRGDRPASADFVRSFVAACLRARRLAPGEIARQVELWHGAWLAAYGYPATSPAGPAEPAAIPAGPAPRQLPATIGDFTGRAGELAVLEKLVPAMDAVVPARAVVAVVTGAAGVGKTSLAVHVAHRIAGKFPDGQVFIDLHGFAETIPPVEPADALDRLLRAMGVPGERIPAALDDRAALWRSVLAGRQMLIVLDNAATEEQVRPLLPGAAGCPVLVTSRRRLAALEIAHPVPLDLLPRAEAVALFDQAAGRPVAVPPDLVAEAVELCGRLPLAIRVAAARLRSHPTWSVADLVARLRDQGRRLSELADDSGSRSVAAALEVSYRHLSTDQQRLYQRLGLFPGSDLDPYAAAALLGSRTEHARRLLDQLLDANLVQEPTRGRYTMHDLVRAHATHLCPPSAGAPRWRAGWAARLRRRTLTRLLDYYRDTAAVAMDAAYPYERDRRPRVPPAGTPIPDLPDPGAATRWLDDNLHNLLAAASHAADHGWPEHACHLSAILHRHLRTRGRYHEAEALHRQALCTGHRPGELAALIGLGRIHQMQCRLPQALDALTAALEVARRTGNRPGQLDALIGLGWVETERGRYEQAVDRFDQALVTARATGDQLGQLDAQVGLGRIHQMQGRHRPALDALATALEIARNTGHRPGQLNALIGLGRVHQLWGRNEEALDRFGQALEIAQAIGDRNGKLNALRGLGQLYLVQGRYQAALSAVGAALRISRTTGNRNGELGALVGLGHVRRRQCRPEQAANLYRAALHLSREIEDRNWQFEALHGLGRLHHATGHPDRAIADLQQALELATALDQPADQARAHDGLAYAYQAVLQREQARQHWQRALDLLVGLGIEHTEDEEAVTTTIRARLAELDSSGAELPRR
jgi:tetratricopeptide (TPR) repeat protein